MEFDQAIKPAKKEELYSQSQSQGEPNKQSEKPLIDPTITGAKNWAPLLTRLNDAQIRDVSKYITMDEFTIEVNGGSRTYKRKKIKTKDYRELEQMRARYASMSSSMEKSELQMQVFQKAAAAYLGMTQEEFESCDFEELKRIIDVQNVRTNYGVPNSDQITL